MAKKEIKDPFDGAYVGNIFGPKITLYGGLIILFFLGLMIYRHWALDVPFGMNEIPEKEKTEIVE